MTDEEFEIYLQSSLDEMAEKQSILDSEYGMGHHERFVVDYETGTLTFFEHEKPKSEASIIPVASHVPEKESLKWAWANENYPESIRDMASFVKKLYLLTGYEMFNIEAVECDESMAWEINALACKVINARGVYRVPHGAINVYVVVTKVRNYG